MSWFSFPSLTEYAGGDVDFSSYTNFEHRDPSVDYYDDNGSPLTWEYDWGDGTVENYYYSDDHSYNSSGTKNVTVTVTDTNLGIDFVTNLSINLQGIPEAYMIVFNSDNDLDVSADASGSSDMQSLNYDYDWGDGTTDTNAGSTQQHTYSSAGTYTVTVTVTDTSNASDKASDTITVDIDDVEVNDGGTWKKVYDDPNA